MITSVADGVFWALSGEHELTSHTDAKWPHSPSDSALLPASPVAPF